MTETATAAIQTSKPLRTGHVIMADGSKTAPNQIEILRAGNWPATSMKGPLNITTADLHEFKANFDAGVGMPAKLKQLPIDFSHADYREAAGWIKALDVVGESLMAQVEWSSEGTEALEGGMYKCISPSFWPACCGEWYDPEDSEVTARNVLVGAGLTNIPFFKDLQPIMASSDGGKHVNENIIYIQADEKKETTMTLDEIRVKDAASLTAEEKQFVADHKSELSTEEQTKFNVADPAPEGGEPEGGEAGGGESGEPENTNTKTEVTPVADQELAGITADIKSGKSVVVNASVFNKMQTDISDMKRKEVEASVATHVARGAIKADQVENWTDRIVKDESLSEILAALPDNPVLASEQGSSTKGGNATAHEQISEAAEKIVADSASTDKPVTFPEAFKQAMAKNPELTKQLNEEREN